MNSLLIVGILSLLSVNTTQPESNPTIRVAMHETQFEADASHRGRARNVAQAAEYLDGAVIAPGATFSFNERVGERTTARGFAEAPELSRGRARQGVGGGVCQVATTLNIAALRAGLEVVSSRPHSLPSHYAAPGLDATVVFGQSDFQVRNPYPFPIVVRAFHTVNDASGTLRVELLAAHAVESSTIETPATRRIPRETIEEQDSTLPPGSRVIAQHGHDGILALVRVSRPDGSYTERAVRYPAVPRIVRVAART